MRINSNKDLDIIFNGLGNFEEALAEGKKVSDIVEESDVEITFGDLSADKWIYRIVVISLGLVALGALFGSIFLFAFKENLQLPDILISLGSAAVGALAGLLAPSPSPKS